MNFRDLEVRDLETLLQRVPGGWEVHVLPLDLVTQGRDFAHAIEMAREAIVLMLHEDVMRGFRPFDRPKAPEECWAPFHQTVSSGESVPVSLVEQVAKSSPVMTVALVFKAWVLRPAELEGLDLPEGPLDAQPVPVVRAQHANPG